MKKIADLVKQLESCDLKEATLIARQNAATNDRELFEVERLRRINLAVMMSLSGSIREAYYNGRRRSAKCCPACSKG